jgi:hypothetical protein
MLRGEVEIRNILVEVRRFESAATEWRAIPGSAKHEPTGIDQGVDITAITKEYSSTSFTNSASVLRSFLSIKITAWPDERMRWSRFIIALDRLWALRRDRHPSCSSPAIRTAKVAAGF